MVVHRMSKRRAGTDDELRTAPLGLRIKPSLKAELERLADADNWTLAGYVERVLEQHVAANKPDKPGRRRSG